MVRFDPATQTPVFSRCTNATPSSQEGAERVFRQRQALIVGAFPIPPTSNGSAERLRFRLVAYVTEKLENQVGARDELTTSLGQFIASFNVAPGDILVAYATSRKSNISAGPLDGGMGRTQTKRVLRKALSTPPPKLWRPLCSSLIDHKTRHSRFWPVPLTTPFSEKVVHAYFFQACLNNNGARSTCGLTPPRRAQAR